MIPRTALAVFMAIAMCSSTHAADNMVGRQSQNEGMVAVPRPGEVTVDGSLDEWDFSGRIWAFADEAVRDAYSAQVAAMYDDEALFIGIKWKDSTPMFNLIDPRYNPEDGWKSDAIQFRVATRDQTTWLTAWHYTTAKQPVLHVAVWKEQTNSRGGQNVTLLTNPLGGADLGQGAQLAFRADEDGKGYVQEMRIPWKLLTGHPDAMKAGETIRMGMEFLYGDATGKAWPAHRYADNVQPGNTRREFFWSALDTWGDLKLIDRNNVETRRYSASSDRLAGRLPLRVEVPADAKRVSLAIDDASGQRVRNLGGLDVDAYTVSESNGKRLLEIPFDGLTDPRRAANKSTEQSIVAPGEYRVRGLYHTGLDARYEMAFYNPGKPAWERVDGTGAWGADHAAPARVAQAGANVILSWEFAEGGSGIIGVGPDGEKIWGEKRGGTFLAANDRHVFAKPEGWHVKEEMLIRLESDTGKYAPFTRDGKPLPFDLPMNAIFGDQVPGRITALAANDDTLAMSMSGNVIVLLDPETATLRKRIELPGPDSLAFAADGTLYALGNVQHPAPNDAADHEPQPDRTSAKLYRINTADGSVAPVATPGLQLPTAIAVDQDGNILVTDRGPDSQVKAFSPDGKLIYTCGKQGGRPIRGEYDPAAMMRMSSVAVDANGHIWVTENWDFPRRVSVWNRNGSLVREYLGGTGYAGTGSYLHQSDPTLGYVGPLEFKLDKDTRTWKLQRILWVPDESKGERLRLTTGTHVLPHRFDSDASGKMRKYLFAAPYRNWEGYYIFMERPDGNWAPVSAIALLGQLSGRIDSKGALAEPPTGEFADCNAFDGVFWNDTNKDAIPQRSECIIVPAKRPATKIGQKGQSPLPIGTGWGGRMDSNLNFYAPGLNRYRPVGFDDDGAPIFTPDSLSPLGLQDNGDLVPTFDGSTLFCLSTAGYPGPTLGLRGIDPKSGRVLWTYPNLFPGVHGSHRASMPKPGLIIGPLKITGAAHINDHVGSVLHLRGNLGQDYLLTHDGIYVDAMFQDTRLPVPSLPQTEEEFFDQSIASFTMGGEPFNGWFGKQSDGAIRLTSALARQACTVLTVHGLESIQRLPEQTIQIDDALVAAFKTDREAAIASAADAANRHYVIPRTPQPMTIDAAAADWGNIASLQIQRDGSEETATARLAYDAENLYILYQVTDPTPWRNEGKDFGRLFKTGDTVDLLLSATNHRENDPKAGDLRIVVGPMGRQPAVVLMKPIAPDAPSDQRRVYSSPVQDRKFDQVRLMNEAKVSHRRAGNTSTIELAIPWSVLGITPQPGLTLGGDLGLTGSDADGNTTVTRIYWANPFTNLVNDEPAEAWLYPSRWGTLELGQ